MNRLWIPIVLIPFIVLCSGSGDQNARKSEQPEQAEIAGNGQKEAEFQEYDVAPQPVGGLAAISDNTIYPEEARSKGIKGNVVVSIRIDEKGMVTKASVVESVTGLDEAALDAIK